MTSGLRSCSLSRPCPGEGRPNTPIKVNYRNGDRAPLLLVAPGRDRIIPKSTSKAAFKLQSKSTAKTELMEYPGRSHYIVGEPGWEEVADHALAWARSVSTVHP